MTALLSGLERPFGVLFLCEDNSRTSLIAEALFRDRAVPRLRAFSAGLNPADSADIYTLSTLVLAGLGREGLWPKSWEGFTGKPDGQIIDLLVLIDIDAPGFVPNAFAGSPDLMTWQRCAAGKSSRHSGVWHEIRSLRPRVNALMDDISAMREFSLMPAAAVVTAS